MAIDFQHAQNRYSYTGRHADAGWAAAMAALVDPRGKRIADVGCGGGIYSAAWHALGAASVTGVDFSAQMLAAAREKTAGLDGLSFVQGEAGATGLAPASVDIVFERALIHHLDDYAACFAEARRLLAPGGSFIIQDRTPEDVALPGSADHIRGIFFECFPRLAAVEAGRRPTHAAVGQALHAAGFVRETAGVLWEVRKVHAGFDALAQDLAARAGRSILHELNDDELRALIEEVGRRVPAGEPIVEKDRWTLWSAVRA